MDIMSDLSLPNYTAIAILEHSGFDLTQKTIDILEALVLMITNPYSVGSDTIKQCVGGDKLAYYFLAIKINELRQKLSENLL